jgi:hypothetical protein
VRNPYIIFAAVSMIVVMACYCIRFFALLGYGFSDDPAIWGQFGDYMGGVLNPILSFISITLLIKSHNLQNQSNHDLREQLQADKKTEKLRSFSTLFFNMLSSQKSLLNDFKIKRLSDNQKTGTGVESIIFIEDQVEILRNNGAEDSRILEFLNEIDDQDRIFGILRAFYITVKIISEKLSASNGFNADDRKDHLLTLINFTDFAQLRLIILAVQFIDCPASQYLRNDSELISLLDEVKLGLDLY